MNKIFAIKKKEKDKNKNLFFQKSSKLIFPACLIKVLLLEANVYKSRLVNCWANERVKLKWKL